MQATANKSLPSLLRSLDKKYLWHPFTQQADWVKTAPLIVKCGRGSYLYDCSGNKYIDGISSLWVTLHGHNHPQLNNAIKRQLGRVAHSTFLGFTHEPGIYLAQKLMKFAPEGLTRVFYSDNGATAVEIALKMAYQYHLQKRKESGVRSQESEGKTEFLALENSYHGDTIGSVSVGGIKLFHNRFKPLLFKTHFAVSPYCYRCKHNKREKTEDRRQKSERKNTPAPGDINDQRGCRWECLADVERILAKRHKSIAAAIIEPLVQAAAGIIVMPRGYMAGFSCLCRKYDVPLICDEVAVGFGRTGYMFACEAEGIKPDFLCLAKSLTGGYLPLAATLATEKIYKAFLGRHEEFKTFFHGHTYTANPLACAAAIENLKLMETSHILKGVSAKSRILQELLMPMAGHPHVGEIRQAGLMAGLELVKDKRRALQYNPGEKIGQKVCYRARSYGVLLRPLGDVIVLVPPLSITVQELKTLAGAVKKAIEDITGNR